MKDCCFSFVFLVSEDTFFAITLLLALAAAAVAVFGMFSRVFMLFFGDLPCVVRRRNARLFKKTQLKLVSMVLRADGHTTKRELDTFKALWVEMYGEKDCLRSLKKLKKMMDEQFDYIELCLDITRNIPYQSRLELLRTLFSIAAADDTTDEELQLIRKFAFYLNVQDPDFESIFALFRHTWYGGRQQQTQRPTQTGHNSWAYTALEITPSATDEEVKKAYRHMAMKYHPDKVNDMGEAAYQSATQKFQALGHAYEIIRRERGMK
ncbi:MAG: DnaJ domain-containing protein [Paludibacteraceae bacterium]|nr:DnaJ domain-containing protein [Paludibacteraceae bacterium]